MKGERIEGKLKDELLKEKVRIKGRKEEVENRGCRKKKKKVIEWRKIEKYLCTFFFYKCTRKNIHKNE